MNTYLDERIIKINEKFSVVEFSEGKWTTTLSEIDNSGAKGYAGIEIDNLVHFRHRKIIKSSLALKAECSRFETGYHLGTGFAHFYAVKLGLIPTSYLYNNYKHFLSNPKKVTNPDLFQGLAGTLLTVSMFPNDTFFITAKNTVFKELISVLKNSDIKNIGFAHGRLGIAYALLASNLYQSNRFSEEYIKETIDMAENRLLSNKDINLAICQGAISTLIVSSLFNLSASSERNEQITDKILEILDNLNQDAPMHLCCGIGGIIETLLCYSSLNTKRNFYEDIRTSAKTFLIEEKVLKINSSGILFGIAGIDFLLAQLNKKEMITNSFLYPFLNNEK